MGTANITRSVLFVGLVVLVLSFNTVYAEDFNSPSWRGDSMTTYQQWEFGSSTNPVYPDFEDNIHGPPLLTIADETASPQWKATDLYGDNMREGVWRFDDYMSVTIGNFNQDNPLKVVWLQMTYYDTGGVEPDIIMDPVYDNIRVVEKVEAGGYWNISFEIEISPNPVEETIEIHPGDGPLYVDEVVIDTICVPEPVSIALLGLGGLVFLRKRRN